MRVTRSVTHIRLCDANHAKIATPDALATEYLRLCQAYTTYFCTEVQPDMYAVPCFGTPLSQRWQRVARENRPNQQTFCCVVCGHTNHADVNAAENLASRLDDQELSTCADRQAIKALLQRRHHEWQEQQRLAVVQPPA